MRAPAYRNGPNYTRTYGPLVADLAARADYPPDDEQAALLDDWFAVDSYGRPAAMELAVVAPRQNLKTGLLKMATLGWVFLLDAPLVVWSAHLFDTSQEAFRDLSNLITAAPFLSKRLAPGAAGGLHSAKGSEAIVLRTGQRVRFKARTETGGRGLSGDKVILDEALALTPAMVGSLLPVLTTRPSAQVAYASSAGLVTSESLRDVRDRGRYGRGKLFYGEWCAPRRPCADPKCSHAKPDHPDWRPGCQLDNRDNWREANPLLGRTRPNGSGFPVERMAEFRRAMSPSEFAREFLGWWDDPGTDNVLPKWADAQVVPPGDLPAPHALGVAVSVDLRWSAVVASVKVPMPSPEGPVERVLVKPLVYGAGTEWVTDKVRDLAAEHYGVPVVVDGGGPASFLVPHLEKAVMRRALNVVDTRRYLDACADFYALTDRGVLAHTGNPELNEATVNATKRPVGDRWAWGRRGLMGDICTLEAATLAVWGAQYAKRVVSTDDGSSVFV